MGLWLKNEDGFVPVSGGGGGSFDGEHVLTGDPDSPPEGWAAGQLLYDGLEDAAGDAGPHDHDYLPLSGGTVTGDLKIDGQIDGTTTINGSINAGYGLYLSGGASRSMISNATGDRRILQLRADLPEGTGPSESLEHGAGISLYGDSDGTYPGEIRAFTGNATRFVMSQNGDAQFSNNLQVDGSVSMGDGKAVYFGGNWEGGRIYNTVSGTREYMVLGNGTVGAQINLYGVNDDISKGNILFYAGEAEGGGSRTVGRWDGPTGAFMAYRDAEVRGDLRVDGIFTPAGGTAFNIADGIDTADVLDRAEVATMPAPEEGVATTDADVDSITVNEVVTALLLKVKELSAEIEELKGN